MDDINALIESYGNAVYGFCLYIAGNRCDGEDLFQQTVLKALDLAKKIDESKNPKSYLLSIAVNLWKNTKAKHARRTRIAPPVYIDDDKGGVSVDSGIDIETEVVNREMRETFFDIVKRLDDKHRIPIILFYSEELKISEIALLLKKPEGTVKRLLHEAKAEIKKEMEAKGYE